MTLFTRKTAVILVIGLVVAGFMLAACALSDSSSPALTGTTVPPITQVPVTIVTPEPTPIGAFPSLLLPLANYPPGETPYFITEGDFWLVHTSAGQLIAFAATSPDYRPDIGLDACRFTWVESVGRFVDPCSGDEWELDGQLNLKHSTELWSNRDLDQYPVTIYEGQILVQQVE